MTDEHRTTEHVIAAIDGALADNEFPDAMRWSPEPDAVQGAPAPFDGTLVWQPPQRYERAPRILPAHGDQVHMTVLDETHLWLGPAGRIVADQLDSIIAADLTAGFYHEPGAGRPPHDVDHMDGERTVRQEPLVNWERDLLEYLREQRARAVQEEPLPDWERALTDPTHPNFPGTAQWEDDGGPPGDLSSPLWVDVGYVTDPQANLGFALDVSHLDAAPVVPSGLLHLRGQWARAVNTTPEQQEGLRQRCRDLALAGPALTPVYGRAVREALDRQASVHRVSQMVGGDAEAWQAFIDSLGSAVGQVIDVCRTIAESWGSSLQRWQETFIAAGLIPEQAPEDVRAHALWLRQHRNTGPERPTGNRAHRPRTHR